MEQQKNRPRYNVRSQHLGGEVEEHGTYRTRWEAIEETELHHGGHDSKHDLKTWVWDIRTGASVFKLGPGEGPSPEVLEEIREAKTVSSGVRKAFRKGGAS